MCCQVLEQLRPRGDLPCAHQMALCPHGRRRRTASPGRPLRPVQMRDVGEAGVQEGGSDPAVGGMPACEMPSRPADQPTGRRGAAPLLPNLPFPPTPASAQ